MVFVYEWKLRWLPSSKDNAHVYIQKAKKIAKRFYIQKAIHLTLWDFHEIFEVGIYIQKAWHFALHDVFIYKKLNTSQKARQFAIRFYMDWFFLLFVYIKTLRKKNGFCIWMKSTMTAIIERQRARIYTQKNKLWNILRYKMLVFIKFIHRFVAINLLTFCKNAKKLFYCSRELSVFRT